MESVISSRQNNIVKYVRSLREKRNRDQEKLFVVEGFKGVAEAVDSGWMPEKIFISGHGENHPQAADILAGVGQAAQIIRVSEDIMDYMSETEASQGIAALIRIPEVSPASLNIGPGTLVVVADGVQDPGNVGTIIRTADAFGADAVLLTGGCADLYNAKTIRSTMGSVFHLPVVNGIEVFQLKDFFRQNGILTAVTSLAESAAPLDQMTLRRPLALILGSEARGVSAALSDDADILLKIPMSGSAQSLNVAVAAGVILYEAFRRHGSSSKSNL